MSNKYSDKVVPTSLYVRNIPHEARPEEIKHLFAKYGHVSDAYLPLDYYTRAPRGFAYVQFDDERDAEDAMYNLDRTRFMGRELEVEMARGDRKTPGQMRHRDRPTHRSRYSRSRSRSPRRRRRSYSPRRRKRSYSRERGRRSRSKEKYHKRHTRSRSRSRSITPQKQNLPRSISRSRSRSISPNNQTYNGQEMNAERDMLPV